jgi:DNA-binding MarR family transcriptional regulator
VAGGDSADGTGGQLGWGLGVLFRAYLVAAGTIVADLPGGPRGHLVLSTAARTCPRTQLALAQDLGIDRTVMTYLLDDLERAGLVERRPDPADRRARQIVATEAGRHLLAALDRRLAQAEDGLLAGLSTAERGLFREMVGRLTAQAPDVPANSYAVAESLEEGC